MRSQTPLDVSTMFDGGTYTVANAMKLNQAFIYNYLNTGLFLKSNVARSFAKFIMLMPKKYFTLTNENKQ